MNNNMHMRMLLQKIRTTTMVMMRAARLLMHTTTVLLMIYISTVCTINCVIMLTDDDGDADDLCA